MELAYGTRECAVLSWRMLLRFCYAMCGTELAYATTERGQAGHGVVHVTCGTELAYGTTERGRAGHGDGGWRPDPEEPPG
eukprot:2063555-Rhodomonas_salina.1